MNGLRDVIINKEPFESFVVECAVCGNELFSTDDYEPGEHAWNEAHVIHVMEEHAKETDHDSMDVAARPRFVLKDIDATITIN